VTPPFLPLLTRIKVGGGVVAQEIVDLYMSLRLIAAPFVAGATEATSAGERMALSINAATKEITLGMDRAAKSTTSASEAITVDTDRLVSTNAKLAASIGSASKEWQTSYKAMAATTQELSMQMELETAKAAASAETMGKKIDAAAKSTTATSVGQAEAVKKLATGVAMAAGVVAGVSLKMAGDFQQSTNKLVTSAGETESGLATVRSGMLQMAGDVGVSAMHLSDAIYRIEGASYHGAAALGMLKAAEQGAKAEGADGVKVADALSSAMRDYYPKAASAEEVTRLSADTMSKFIGATSRGKMTFDELAGGLNNILPIASQYKIKMEDVLGVLATMTVHGISAQQATDNINHAIQKLAGGGTAGMQSFAASLGISMTDVQQKLGQRGLAGSLQYLSEAVKKSMPPGSDQVIINLGNAVSHSSEQVKELARQLAVGEISHAAYTKAVGGLTGEEYKQGKQFDNLLSSYHQLGSTQKSGMDVLQTYGGAMQKLTGDMTTLKVALFTTGENTDYTNESIKTIANSTADAAGNVKGWAEIQGTFNQKMSQAKEGAGAFAIQIGNYLLPVASKIAGVIGDATRWLAGNETASRSLAIAIGVVLVGALGAGVVGIIGWVRNLSAASTALIGTTAKLGGLAGAFLLGLSNMDSFAGVATVVITSITGIGTAVDLLKGPWNALPGLFSNAKAGIGNFIGDIGAAEGAIGKFKVAGGGLMSFLTGPWGIALGLAVGAIALFTGGSKDANVAVDDLTKAIEQDSGQLGTNTRAWIVNKLEKDDALTAAKGLGLAEKDVTDALIGQGPALDGLKTKLQGIVKAGTEVSTVGDQVTGALEPNKMTDAAVAAQKLIDEINGVSGSLNASRDAAIRQSDALHQSAGELDKNATSAVTAESSSKNLAGTSQKVADAMSAEKNEAKLLTDQLDFLNGGNIDAAKGAIRFKDSVDTTAKALVENNKQVDLNTEKGRKSLTAILDAATAAKEHAKAVATQTHSVEEGNKAFEGDVAALQAVMKNAHLTADQIQWITDKYLQVPHDITTNVHADISQAWGSISALKGLASSVASWIPGMKHATGGPVGHFAEGGIAHFEPGGPVSGPGTDSSDSILSMLSDDEYVTRARAVRKVGQPVMDAINSGDVNGAYRMLAARPDVNRGGGAGGLAVRGGGGTTVINNNYVVQAGSIISENDLQTVVQEVVLRYAQRNNGAGLRVGWNT
jgi:hypothetical protein